jgi:uncharacterized membrane protein YwzB
LVGNLTVTLAITFLGAELILSGITFWNEEFVAKQRQTLLMFWAVMVMAFFVNAFVVKYLIASTGLRHLLLSSWSAFS